MKDRIENFRPPFGLRSRHTQSLLSSSPIRRRVVWRRSETLRANQQALLLDGGDEVRLEGFLSAHPSEHSRGLVTLLHGWEGSVNSNYILSNGARLFAAGFDVFRLNFRDHGDTHHLNPGMFHSNRLDEVVNALADLQKQLNARSWMLAGYSLGGNFALRVALQAPAAGLDLRQVVGICPVIDPAKALQAMEDGNWFYERYFEQKWNRSLAIKRQCFPELYADDDWSQLGSIRERTHYLATRYAGFKSSEAYYDGYSIAGQRLEQLEIASTILTAADDPVVPVEDFWNLPRLPNLQVMISPHGGHCGFLKNWKFDSLAEDLILERAESASMQQTAGTGRSETNDACGSQDRFLQASRVE